MKIGIYDPYLDTLGGGERYMLTLARCLSEHHDVTIFWNDKNIGIKIREKLAIDIDKVKFAENIFAKSSSTFKKIQITSSYDVIFFLSDGSIPLLLSKKNFLIVQYPTSWTNPKSITNRIKLSKFNKIICYSEFVKSFIDKAFPIISVVIPPAVETNILNLEKENIILSVGRFTKAINSKKQEVMIDAFKNIAKGGLSGWKLIIAGSVLADDLDLIKKLKEESSGYPIEILPNLNNVELNKLYSKSKIYWHATGFGEDLEKHPEYAEHFGISTVEAMNAGVVPVVIKAGGQSEIISDGENGFLWDDLKELEDKTLDLINNEKKLEEFSSLAKKRAKDFSEDRFCHEMNSLIV